ncbi:O-antigen ligase family protein [Candidatus Planktophila dulcis]|uniref:O-antigen ligase family protein n=1 Tax=Candidatus Planktophila dulcis TaxID=1884914 RepID=UPI003CF36F69
MSSAISEKLITKILSIGSALTTILIISGSVTDPVNTPKFVAIGVIGVSALGVLFSSAVRNLLREHKLALLLVCLFMFSMSFALFSSDSPVTQNLYGSYGRNNGFLTYLFLASIFLSALVLRRSSNFEYVIKGLLFAGIINIAYCLWVIMFGDFVGWSNPYGNILGTLGNPNFIGSFLGIFFAAYLAFALKSSAPKMMRYSLLAVLPVTAFEIYDSHAIQGRVVAALGVGILGFLLIRSRFGNGPILGYLLVSFVVGLFALLGALQIGPLTSYIYKTSVSLRGQYWLAGWNTGESHPITGVGMDSFGDWYRRSRDLRAIELPGVNTVVNAAHNVPLDMFAFGGWPLLLTYLSIMGLAAFAAIKLIIRTKAYDPILAVLVTAWVGYQVQSIISINQIGLAVWGWLLSGLLIAYECSTRSGTKELCQSENQAKRKTKSQPIQPQLFLIGLVGGVIGLLIALPPFTSDAKWRSAQLARTVPAIEESMQASYFNPQNSMMYMTNIQSLEQSGLFNLSYKYALEAVKWNPESFDLWKVLYLIRDSTAEDKVLALENMKRLDPLNPDVTSIQ